MLPSYTYSIPRPEG